MTNHDILSENSEHHWPYLQTAGKVLLDLGCGRHDTSDLYQSSAVYLGEKGATKVVAIDGSASEIEYFTSSNPNPNKYTFLHKFINNTDDIRELLKEYNPSVVKCDIDILSNITEKLTDWGFTIDVTARFAFVDAPQMGVLFCTKNR